MTRGESISEPKRRPGGRSARVRDAVLDAALAQLLENGYENLSFREVALSAGVAETTVYRRWPSKSELARAAIAKMAATENPLPDTGALESDLRELLGHIFELLRRPEIARLVRTVAALENEGPTGEAQHSFWHSRFAGSSTVVMRAVERGEVPSGVDAESVIEFLVAPAYLRLLLTGLPIDDGLLEESIRRTLLAFRS